jgi:hypothetical protein
LRQEPWISEVKTGLDAVCAVQANAVEANTVEANAAQANAEGGMRLAQL